MIATMVLTIIKIPFSFQLILFFTLGRAADKSGKSLPLKKQNDFIIHGEFTSIDPIFGMSIRMSSSVRFITVLKKPLFTNGRHI